jgi:hypothetical protein
MSTFKKNKSHHVLFIITLCHLTLFFSIALPKRGRERKEKGARLAVINLKKIFQQKIIYFALLSYLTITRDFVYLSATLNTNKNDN